MKANYFILLLLTFNFYQISQCKLVEATIGENAIVQVRTKNNETTEMKISVFQKDQNGDYQKYESIVNDSDSESDLSLLEAIENGNNISINQKQGGLEISITKNDSDVKDISLEKGEITQSQLFSLNKREMMQEIKKIMEKKKENTNNTQAIKQLKEMIEFERQKRDTLERQIFRIKEENQRSRKVLGARIDQIKDILERKIKNIEKPQSETSNEGLQISIKNLEGQSLRLGDQINEIYEKIAIIQNYLIVNAQVFPQQYPGLQEIPGIFEFPEEQETYPPEWLTNREIYERQQALQNPEFPPEVSQPTPPKIKNKDNNETIFDLQTPFASQFEISGYTVEFMGQNQEQSTQLMIDKVIKPNQIFKFFCRLVNRQSNNIIIGVVDRSKQKNEQNSWNSGNAVCFWGNGIIFYGLGMNTVYEQKQEEDGFYEGQTITVIVDLNMGNMKWQVKNEVRGQINTPMLSQSNRQFVPYIQIQNNGVVVQLWY